MAYGALAGGLGLLSLLADRDKFEGYDNPYQPGLKTIQKERALIPGQSMGAQQAIASQLGGQARSKRMKYAGNPVVQDQLDAQYQTALAGEQGRIISDYGNVNRDLAMKEADIQTLLSSYDTAKKREKRGAWTNALLTTGAVAGAGVMAGEPMFSRVVKPVQYAGGQVQPGAFSRMASESMYPGGQGYRETLGTFGTSLLPRRRRFMAYSE